MIIKINQNKIRKEGIDNVPHCVMLVLNAHLSSVPVSWGLLSYTLKNHTEYFSMA